MKEIEVVIYQRHFIKAWQYEFNPAAIKNLVQQLDQEYQSAQVRVSFGGEEKTSVQVGGYSDILNAIRLRTTGPGAVNHCLGHILGESKNCDLLEDIRRGISKLAFAPETIMPEEAHRKVCHNCGCGC